MLTDAAIKKIKKPDLNQKTPDKHTDTHGLQLHVFANGRMTWIYAYRLDSKQKTFTIGKYPQVSLADARRARDDARRQVEQQIDPSRAKQQIKRQGEGLPTFELVAREWHTTQSPKWSDSTIIRAMRRLENDVFPYIGKLPIAQITAPDLLQVMRRIETRSVDTAYRALQECGQIFRYGVATGRNQYDPSAALKGALAPRITKHFAAIIEPDELAKLLRVIDGFNGTFVVKCALQVAPMMFVRIGELRTAKWTDIDLQAGEWRYFVSKTKQNHIVALPRQAIAILSDLKQLTGEFEHVFYGGRNRHQPMSEAAINAALRRMGYDTKTEITGHGFRATARTLLHERLRFPPDVIEHQLAHSVPDSLGTSYNRTRFIDERRTMMQAWADYLDELKQGQVIRFPKATA